LAHYHSVCAMLAIDLGVHLARSSQHNRHEILPKLISQFPTFPQQFQNDFSRLSGRSFFVLFRPDKHSLILRQFFC